MSDKGNASKSVMELIMELENKVRERTEQRDEYKKKYWMECFGHMKSLSTPNTLHWWGGLLIGLVLGVVSSELVWMIVHRGGNSNV